MKNNVLERAVKTFIFAFLGVLVPEVCVLLTGSPSDIVAAYPVVVVSIICAALAAGLSATWNYLENWWRSDAGVEDAEIEEVE